MHKLVNIGCKLNQYEGFCLAKKHADKQGLIIINTCCVTKEAETKSLRKFRSAQRQYPGHKIIATGCACRLTPEKYSTADEVIDNVKRNELIKGIFPEPERSRYFLKIQDGCNGKCSFCIVAKIRDKVESKSMERIISEIDWVVSRGYQEIVLVGANIGLYGFDMGKRLVYLLKELRKISYLPRIRLSSLEPRFINEELIKCLKDLPFCRHFHLPIQSADDSVLNKMNRQYNRRYLEKTISLITGYFNDCAIGADIIVGFPGETTAEFLNTSKFIKTQPFTHLHIFPYSPRPLTSAYSLEDPVDRRTKKERLWQLKDLIKVKNFEFRKSLINKTFDVIVESRAQSKKGLTDNYIRVDVNGDHDKKTLVKVKITDVLEDKTFGSIQM
ncbi:MAG: MiaB/RimO family radical SAM methylthiotransferase [bacterium]